MFRRQAQNQPQQQNKESHKSKYIQGGIVGAGIGAGGLAGTVTGVASNWARNVDKRNNQYHDLLEHLNKRSFELSKTKNNYGNIDDFLNDYPSIYDANYKSANKIRNNKLKLDSFKGGLVGGTGGALLLGGTALGGLVLANKMKNLYQNIRNKNKK